MAATKILKCNCNSPFQDQQYGLKMRVHNLRDQKKHPGEAFCTVCGKNNTVKN